MMSYETFAPAPNLTAVLNNLTSHALPSHVTSNETEGANVLVLTTAMKGIIMLYNTIVLVIGVFGNGGVLYLSLRHGE